MGEESESGDSENSFDTKAAMTDPVMLAFNTLFEQMNENINTTAEQKLYALEIS